MVDCGDHKSKEANDALASRILATLDSINGTDNTHGLDNMSLDAQLHYSAWKTELDMEKPVYGPVEIDKKLASPYKDYFNTKNEKLNTILNNATHLVMGNHPDYSVRPSEVLGDNVVRPLEDSYRKYAAMLSGEKENGTFDAHIKDIENKNFDNPELREKLAEIREDSGYIDALDEAQEIIEDQYGDGQDDARYKYGMSWIESQKRPVGEDSFPIKMVTAATRNLTENLLRNNIVSAGRNYFDRWRAAYQFGIHNYSKGERLYNAAKNSNSPELIEAGIHGSQFIEGKKGPDLFSMSEPGNKGITYFAAKAHALEQGMTTAQAKLYGKKAIEQIQFQGSFVNRPKAQWGSQGRTNLSLWTFGLHERRWYNSLWRGSFSSNQEAAKMARRGLLYYGIGNAVLFGANADIPEELGQAWKLFAPASYREWREGMGTYSLARLLNVSLDEVSRVPLTGVGLLTKIPVVYDSLQTAAEDTGKVIEHPNDPKKYLKAITSGSMLLPAGFGIKGLDNIGNKMTMATVQYLHRTVTGNYEHRTFKNKKYHTDNLEELGNAIRGGRESFDRKIKKDKLDARAPLHPRIKK